MSAKRVGQIGMKHYVPDVCSNHLYEYVCLR